ncbi:hypothetical protein D3C86_1874720 [compost metagenome]
MRLRRQPVHAAILPHHAVFQLVVGAVVDRILHVREQPGAVIRVHALQEGAERLFALAGGQAQQRGAVGRPVHAAVGDFSVG